MLGCPRTVVARGFGKIAGNPELREFVREHLKQRWSPRQISNRLRSDFPEQPEMHIVPETVYPTLYGRGSLDLAVDPAVSLRSGRTGRRPRRRKEHRTRRFPDMVMIRDRPAEVIGRLVPGHWEGDLIIGKGSRSAIGTLVERTTRFIVLVHLAGNRGAENLRDRLAETMGSLPAHLRRSLTWDQGTEMACHQDFTRRTLIPFTSATPPAPGSAVRMRTPMACFGSTSRKAPISAFTAQNTSPGSLLSSTEGHAKSWGGRVPWSIWLDCPQPQQNHKLLQRQLNSAAVTMAHFSTVTDKQLCDEQRPAQS